MPSMYETIMDLPLFKGIGDEQLSIMLEKTKVEFLKFEDGEIIYERGENVSGLYFILNGRVKQTYNLTHNSLAIDEILGKGSVLGALHLFGMNTKYPSNAVALGKVSLMRIGKSQYLNILRTDQIYLINFVNYLSAAAQKAQSLLSEYKGASITRTLETLAFSVVSRGAETVMVAGDDKSMAEYCGVSQEDFNLWKSIELAHNRIIANQRGIFLRSPHLLR